MPTFPQDHPASPLSGSRSELSGGSPLRIARTGMLIACLLTFIQSGVEFFTAESQFEAALERELQRLGGNVQMDQGRVRNARVRYVRTTKVKAMVIAGLGAALLLLSWLVYRFPLFCTLGGLVLFLTVTITLAFFSWYSDIILFLLNNWKSVTWELVITASLIMAVQAALLQHRQRTLRVKALMGKLDEMLMA